MKNSDWPLWVFLIVGVVLEFWISDLCQNYFGMNNRSTKIMSLVVSEIFIGSFIWGYVFVCKFRYKISAWFIFISFLFISSLTFYYSLKRGIFPVLHYLWFYDYYLEIFFIVLAIIPSVLIMRLLEKYLQHKR